MQDQCPKCGGVFANWSTFAEEIGPGITIHRVGRQCTMCQHVEYQQEPEAA